MSIFGDSCDEMNGEIRKKFDRPEKKEKMSKLKEQISDLQEQYSDALADGDAIDARALRDDICEKEKKLTSLIDGY